MCVSSSSRPVCDSCFLTMKGKDCSNFSSFLPYTSPERHGYSGLCIDKAISFFLRPGKRDICTPFPLSPIATWKTSLPLFRGSFWQQSCRSQEYCWTKVLWCSRQTTPWDWPNMKYQKNMEKNLFWFQVQGLPSHLQKVLDMPEMCELSFPHIAYW